MTSAPNGWTAPIWTRPRDSSLRPYFANETVTVWARGNSCQPTPHRYGAVVTETPRTLVLERRDAVQWIRLDRPDARNAINKAMRDELVDAFLAADYDPEVRALTRNGAACW
jgi:hypothetical protein